MGAGFCVGGLGCVAGVWEVGGCGEGLVTVGGWVYESGDGGSGCCGCGSGGSGGEYGRAEGAEELW